MSHFIFRYRFWLLATGCQSNEWERSTGLVSGVRASRYSLLGEKVERSFDSAETSLREVLAALRMTTWICLDFAFTFLSRLLPADKSSSR